MTANWRRKRRVRARMAKTGESYTAALRHLLRSEEELMTTYLQHGGVTDVGNVRESNQDELLVEGDLLAVADGMGGHAAGDLASRLAIQTLRERFAADTTADGLVAAVAAANRVVWERSESDPELRGMGTTIAATALVSEVGESRLAVVNVGDSRAYLLRQGLLSRLSSDHSLVADLVRAGQLSDEEARWHPRRNILTRVLGVAPEIEPHVASAVPAHGDRLLLCSDGLFNELSEAVITEVLTTVRGADDAAAQLVQRAKDHGGNDNITAVVADIA